MLALIMGCLAVSAPAQTPYDSAFEQFKGLTATTSRAAVKNVVLRRDVMELRLDSGFAYLLTPIAGRTLGIAFLGNGTFSFEPPLAVEQYNLQHELGDSTVNGPITAAVFLFADSTGDELQHHLSFSSNPTTRAGDVDDAVGAALDYLVDGRAHAAEPDLFATILNKTTTGFFAAYIKRAHGESVMMEFDPSQAEEVLLLRRGKMIGQRTETLCQFQRTEDLAHDVSVASKQPDALLVSSYDIDATIDGNYKFAARTVLRLAGQRAQQQWLPFYLYRELNVDSVTDEAGTPLMFYRREHQPELWLRIAKPFGPGDTVTVRVAYHGNLIAFGSAMDDFLPPWWDPRRHEFAPILDSWAFIKSPSNWYPRYSFEQRATFAMAFHTPKRLQFATIGRLVDSSTTGDVTTTRWASELPARNVSFNIGKFDQLDIRDQRIPPVTVQVNTEAHRAINQLIPSARQPAEVVG